MCVFRARQNCEELAAHQEELNRRITFSGDFLNPNSPVKHPSEPTWCTGSFSHVRQVAPHHLLTVVTEGVKRFSGGGGGRVACSRLSRVNP